jgi:hypothetical protein
MIDSPRPAAAGRRVLRHESPAREPLPGQSLPPRRGHCVKAGSQPADYGRVRRSRPVAQRRKQACKRSRRSSHECIAAAPDLWFEGLGFPHPVKPAKDPIRGADLIGSRVHPGCRGSAGSAPEPAVVTKTRRSACRGKMGPVFRYGHAQNRRISGCARRSAPGEQEQ